MRAARREIYGSSAQRRGAGTSSWASFRQTVIRIGARSYRSGTEIGVSCMTNGPCDEKQDDPARGTRWIARLVMEGGAFVWPHAGRLVGRRWAAVRAAGPMAASAEDAG